MPDPMTDAQARLKAELVTLLYDARYFILFPPENNQPIIKALDDAIAALSSTPDAQPSSTDEVERLAYTVANSKLGEGPEVRCEGPTEFEIDQARQWVRRCNGDETMSGKLRVDWERFGEAVRAQAVIDATHITRVGRDLGLSHPRMVNAAQGKPVGTDIFLTLCNWMQVDPMHFALAHQTAEERE
jgi:hypothetical protein